MKTKKVNPKLTTKRNDVLFDKWSVVHIVSSAILAAILGPWVALAIVWLWEPVEVLILSPILGRYGILFGHETWRNVLSDLIVDAVGVGLGVIIVQTIT